MGAQNGLQQQDAQVGAHQEPSPRTLGRRLRRFPAPPAHSLSGRGCLRQPVWSQRRAGAHRSPGQVDRWAGPSSLSGREAGARSAPACPRALALPPFPALCFHFLPVPFFSQVLLMTFQPHLLFIESFTPEHRKML